MIAAMAPSCPSRSFGALRTLRRYSRAHESPRCWRRHRPRGDCAGRDGLREGHRVLVTGGRPLHEWGNGAGDEEWVQIRDQVRALFEEVGVASPFHPGVRPEPVDESLKELGLVRRADVRIGPGPGLTLAEFLRRLVEGELSYIWNVLKNVQDPCLSRLQASGVDGADVANSPLTSPKGSM